MMNIVGRLVGSPTNKHGSLVQPLIVFDLNSNFEDGNDNLCDKKLPKG